MPDGSTLGIREDETESKLIVLDRIGQICCSNKQSPKPHLTKQCLFLILTKFMASLRGSPGAVHKASQ